MEIHNVKLDTHDGCLDGFSRLYTVVHEFLDHTYTGKRLIITYEDLKEAFPYNILILKADKKEIHNQLKTNFKNSWLYSLSELKTFRTCYSNGKPDKYRSLYEQILYYSEHADNVDLKTYSTHAVTKLLRAYIEEVFTLDMKTINTCFNSEIEHSVHIPIETLHYVLEDAIDQIREQLRTKQPAHKQALILTVENSRVLLNTLGRLIRNKEENKHGE